MIVLRALSLIPHIRKDVEIAGAKKSHIQKFQIGLKLRSYYNNKKIDHMGSVF